MHKRILASAILAVGVAVAPAVVTGAAGAATGHSEGSPGAVFVQTDNLSGNQIVSYQRASDGALTWAATYDTDGLGGQLNGAAVDFLASQGSLAYVQGADLLLAVNAGSNSISVFTVRGTALALLQTLPSGGSFPSSIAVSGDLAYVLNARGGGSLAGFSVSRRGLDPVPGSVTPLGLTTPTDPTEFTHTPGQVAFSPSGRQLLVTTKATTSAIDVFGVASDGLLSSPTANVEPGAVPFALIFDRWGNAVVANAGPSSVSTFTLNGSGTLTPVATAATGQAATCWISTAKGRFYVSNSGSATLSGFDESHGSLSAPTTTPTDPGPVDSAATTNGKFLYVQGGKFGTVDGFAVGPTGALTVVGTVTVPGAAGGEGIVAF